MKMTEMGSPEHRARLAPVMQQLKDAKESVFLDLCELVIMLAEEVEGKIDLNHERVRVTIKHKKRSKKSK